MCIYQINFFYYIIQWNRDFFHLKNFLTTFYVISSNDHKIHQFFGVNSTLFYPKIIPFRSILFIPFIFMYFDQFRFHRNQHFFNINFLFIKEKVLYLP